MVTINQIYDTIVNQITQDRQLYCSSTLEPVSAADHFPACQIVEMNHPIVQTALPLNFQTKSEVTLRRDFEAHVFSNLKNGALSQAREIMSDVEIAFLQIGFIETACTQSDNADPSVIHLVARFTRNICDGDSLTVE